MSSYIDVDGIRRAAHAIDEASNRMSRAAQQMEDAAARIAHLLEPGYGGSGLRLIELLEAAQENKS